MRAMLSRLRARDAALFVVIAGLVAAGVFAAAREAGVGERADAGTKATPAEQRTAAQQQDGGEEQGTPPGPAGAHPERARDLRDAAGAGVSGGAQWVTRMTMEPGTSKGNSSRLGSGGRDAGHLVGERR